MQLIQRNRLPPLQGIVPSRSGKPAAAIGKRGKEKKLQAGQYEMMEQFVFLVASPWFYLAGYSSASKMDPAVPSRKSVTLPKLRSLQTFSSPTNALVEFIKTRLKLGRLLQHVSVYKETIIREPVSA